MAAPGRSRAALALALLVSAGPARGQTAPPASPAGSPAGGPSVPASRVVVLHPPGADPLTSEAVARVTGELAAAGFAVTALESQADAEPRAEVDAASRAHAPVAVFALRAGPPGGEAEIWLSDRTTGATEVRRVDLRGEPPGRAPVVLAVRAVEILRGALEGIAARAAPPRARPAAPAPAAALKAALPPAPPRRPLELVAGLGGLGGPGGIGPSALPWLGVGLRARGTRWLFARASGGGYGTRPLVEAPEGQARVTQALALVEVGARAEGRAVEPGIALGLGAHRASAQGAGGEGYAGLEAAAWSFAASAGAGLRVPLGGRLALLLDGRALFLGPEPRLRIAGRIAARTGRPALLATLGLAVSP